MEVTESQGIVIVPTNMNLSIEVVLKMYLVLIYSFYDRAHAIRNSFRNVEIVGKSTLVLDLYSSFAQNRNFVRVTVMFTF